MEGTVQNNLASVAERKVLLKEVKELREQLEALRKTGRVLQEKVDKSDAALEAKEKRLERKARREAEKQARSPQEAEMVRLEDLTKLYSIFGLEMVTCGKQGATAVFHQWNDGAHVEKYSVEVRQIARGRLEVVKHTMPTGTPEWLRRVPCQVPHATRLPDLLRELHTSAAVWFYRSQQLKELRAKNTDLQVSFPMDLSSVFLQPTLRFTSSKLSVKFEVELRYSESSPFPTECRVSVTKNSTEEGDGELEQQMTEQCQPFQRMELAEAFYFCFLAKDDTTRRSFVADLQSPQVSATEKKRRAEPVMKQPQKKR